MASSSTDEKMASAESLSDYLPSCVNKDTLTYCVVVVGYLVSYCFGKRVWRIVDFVTTGLMALPALIIPDIVMKRESYMELNGVHWTACRAWAAVLIGMCTMTWLTWKSRDATVHTSLLWSRVMVLGTALMSYGHLLTPSVSKESKLNVPVMRMVFIWIFMWLLGNVIYSFRSKDWGGYQESFSTMNRHLRIDFLIAFICGSIQFVYPKLVLQTQCTVPIDAYAVLTVRMVGLFSIGTAIVSARAVNFLSEMDKKATFISRAVQISLTLVILIYGHNAYSVFSSWHVFTSILGSIIWLINSIMGYQASAY